MADKSLAKTLREYFWRKRGGRTVDERLQDVLDDLLTIERLEELTRHPAGEQLMGVLRYRVEALQREINGYTRDPIKHERDIVYAGALRDAIAGLIELVETTLQWRPELMKERQTLEREKADLAKRQSAEKGA